MALFYSVIIAFSKDRKKILLGKRREDNKFTSIAGGGEPSETPKKAAIREAFEEANLKLKESDLKFLTSLTAKNGKPIFVYTTLINPNQDIHVKNDPDKEVPSWKFYPLDSIPALDKNRLETVNMAKMKIQDLIKSVVSTDMFSGVDLRTEDFSQDDMASRDTYWHDAISALVKDIELNVPVVTDLEDEKALNIIRIGEGIYSGNIKDSENGDKIINFNELSIASLIQMLKAKEFIGKEEAYKKDSPVVEKLDEISEKLEVPPEGDSDVKIDAPGIEGIKDLMDKLKNIHVEGDLNITIKKSLHDLINDLYKAANPRRGKRGFPVGTKRTWSNGVTAVKHADGWVVVGGQHHGKLMGKFKEAATHSHVAEAYKEVDDVESQIKSVKQAHEAKLKQIQDEHDKHIADLKVKQEANKQKKEAAQAKIDAKTKKIAELKARLKEGAALEEKRKGSEKKTEGSQEGKGSSKEETQGKEKSGETRKEEEAGSDGDSKRPVESSLREDEKSKVAGETKKELTEEQQAMRDRNARHFERIKEHLAHIGSKTKAEFIKSEKERLTKEIKEKHPEVSDAIIKDAIIRNRVTASSKNKYDAVINYAPKYGLKMSSVMASETSERDKKKERKEVTTGEGSEITESGLNKKTNMVKSVDFSKTSKKNRDTLMRHLNDSNKIVEHMGIEFKTSMAFKCDRLGNNTKRTRATYSRGREKTVTLKDKANANKSVMHEIGHGLDDALGQYGFRSDELQNIRNTELQADFKELLAIVSDSKYYTEAGASFKRYLVKPTEVFARAFEVHSLVKAEELIAKGEISKDFLDSFLPDVFKQSDEKLANLQKEQKDLNKEYYQAGPKDKDKRDTFLTKLREVNSQVSNRVKELGGYYVEVSKEQQAEYKTKISTLMDRILASDEIKKALNLFNLISSLKEMR